MAKSAKAESVAQQTAVRLRRAFGAWLKLLGTEDVWDWVATQRNRRQVRSLLSRFKPPTTEDDEGLAGVLSGLSRSKYLVEAALTWADPCIGPGPTRTALARGEQWQLAIAWAGVECQIKAVLEIEDNGVKSAKIDEFVTACGLADQYVELAPPRRELKDLRRWLKAERRFDREAILVYLGPTAKHEEKGILCDWLVRGNSIKRWSDALRLAQQLRHKTAHGALSATKACTWGLRPAFRRLVIDLAVVTARVFEKMGEGQEMG